ncbi:MAG: YkvA family protein [Tissierella sp.]|uniref:YkvA family protein n=1 Tax=Tissierella sp. TaxID=41274 RepID=UPI003F952E34
MKIDFEEVKNKFGEKANDFYEDNEKLGELIDEFSEKIKDSKILETVGEDLKLTLDMIMDWKNGDYKDLSKDSVTIIVMGFLYILSPISVIPKFIPLRHIDDILVLVYVIKKVKEELEIYKKWRIENEIFDTDDIDDETTYIDIS